VTALVAIAGGGISGLAAAYELQRLGVPFVLLEQSPTCGGVVRTDRVDGYTIDAGPDALLTQKPAAIELCRELGLAERLRPQKRRATYVVRNGVLRELPEASVLGIPTRWTPFVTTRAFSWRGKLRMAAECLLPRGGGGDDESIASFIGRRFGTEAVDYLAEPLLAGIHGGDPARLSMRVAFPRFLELEKKYGSVIAGLRTMAAAGKAAAPHGAPSPFVSLPGGMGELTAALLKRIPPASIRTGAGVRAIAEVPSGGYLLTLSDGSRLMASSLLLATPPAVTAKLLRGVDSKLAFLCGRIQSASVVTIALGYRRSAIGHPLDGAGLVVPRREGLSIRALSWVSSKWEGRAPVDRVLLRAYAGGMADPGAIYRRDDEILDSVCRDVASLVGAQGEPEMARIYRWRDATPQLEVGHAALMAQIDEGLAAWPGLAVTASGFRGTGIADCVSDARREAGRAADRSLVALTA
jgi:oxygen-dependent protoporphyrinogen oxidase